MSILILMAGSLILGIMLAWNFAVYKLELDIKSGSLKKDGKTYDIIKRNSELSSVDQKKT